MILSVPKDKPWQASWKISQGNLKPLWGKDGESVYIDESLPWAWREGEYIVIDTDASNGIATPYADGVVID